MNKRIILFFLTLALSVGLLAIKYKGDLETNNEVVFPDLTTPGNPVTGFNKLYFKSDDEAYSLNSGGTEKRVGFTDSIVDGDISEAEGFLRKTGAGAYEGIKSNLGATTDPDNNEDSNDGYAIGSIWINVTLDSVHRAVDVTVGSAVWKDLSAGAAGALVLGTKQATTSGTDIDFTGIPAGVKRVMISFEGVGLSGSNEMELLLGDSVGFETSGYVSQRTTIRSGTTPTMGNQTTGFLLDQDSGLMDGIVILTRMDDSHLWAMSGIWRVTSSKHAFGTGTKTISAELTQIRITPIGGNTFDAGSINIMHE